MDGIGEPIPMQRILRTWWPLAASWLLMGVEQPAVTAIIARLKQPEINLAAYGGVVYPLALIIEAPIIMLLAASTALSQDYGSYQKVRRFMTRTSGALTLLHVLVAFTPLYDLLVVKILAVPREVVEPARLGLRIMLPWTWSIAYRRFNQGALIRFGHSSVVGSGTVVRLCADGLVLALGYLARGVPGIVVGAAAVIAGVVSEAIYVGWRIRPVVAYEIRAAPALRDTLTLRSFLEFYVPLAMTSLLAFLAQPIGSAALSRMPLALASLATWPVLTGLNLMLRSPGIAFNEVVVALIGRPGLAGGLRRFTAVLATSTTLLLLAIVATPLAGFWFENVAGLDPELAGLARTGLWLVVPLPALSALQSWFQGAILHSRRTRAITEAVAIYLGVTALSLVIAVAHGRIVGLYAGLAALAASTISQTAWLWWRGRAARRL